MEFVASADQILIGTDYLVSVILDISQRVEDALNVKLIQAGMELPVPATPDTIFLEIPACNAKLTQYGMAQNAIVSAVFS